MTWNDQIKAIGKVDISGETGLLTSNGTVQKSWVIPFFWRYNSFNQYYRHHHFTLVKILTNHEHSELQCPKTPQVFTALNKQSLIIKAFKKR